ncbi:MAG: hypothetical protein RR022_06325, partial [Angelakisella sp.]
GSKVFTVQGRLAFGHCLEISNAFGELVGTVREELLTFLPRFRLYSGDQCMGEIRKEFTLFRPSFAVDCNGWRVDGDWFEWDYRINDPQGRDIASIEKQLLNFSDTYVIDVTESEHALMCLMIVLAIDAVKCSQN